MQLTELRERVSALPTLEKRLELIKKELQRSMDEVSNLLRRYEQERRDVEEIQKESFSAFLYRLVGKYEDKLEKEQREEIDAKLAYDRAVIRRDSLMREKEYLESRIAGLCAEEQMYQAELAKRRRKLETSLAEPMRRLYAELENEWRTIVSQMTEIREALSAASRAKLTAQEAIKSLEKAQSWATYDVFTRGGIISHMAKYSHIDSAEKNFHQLSSQLHDLRSELNDVHGLTISGFSEISSGQRAIDFWFDNIFTDLSVKRQINDNTGEITRLLSSLDSAESALKLKLQADNERLAENRRREEELLLALK